MRILIVHPMLSWRGAERLSLNLALSLQKRGHKVGYVTLYVDPKNPQKGIEKLNLLMPPLLLQNIFMRSRPLFLILGFWMLLLLAFKHSKDYDIINAHNIPAPWVSFIVGSIKRIPKIWTVYNLPEKVTWRKKANLMEYFLWTIINSFLDVFMVRGLDNLVSCSKQTSLEIKRRYAKHSVLILPPVTSGFIFSGKKSKPKSINKFILVCAAHMHPAKNQIAVIKAFPKIMGKVKNPFLILAGNGPWEKKYKRVVERLKIKNHVLFPGVLSEKEMAELYRKSHIVLVPALREPLGLTPFEALASGTVPLVSTTSGAAEVIRDAGIGYITKPTPQSFARSIIEIYNNRTKANKIAIKGQRWVRSNMRYGKYAIEHEKVFKSFYLKANILASQP